MLHDPTNKDEIYQSGMLDNEPESLCDEFEYHYERKLDSFQDKMDEFSDIFKEVAAIKKANSFCGVFALRSFFKS